MKKAIFALFVCFLAVNFSSAQSTTTPPAVDFFAGKWEVVFKGTPQGDVKLIANLTRKEGKLTGEFTDPTGAQAEAIPITSIDEAAEKITLSFSAQGYDLNVELEKVDDNNLKGMMMNMFESTAARVVTK